MEQIYGGIGPFELNHLPAIVNRRDHAVMFELPINVESTVPPRPHVGPPKWDSVHVRLPCAVQNEYIVADEVGNRRMGVICADD